LREGSPWRGVCADEQGRQAWSRAGDWRLETGDWKSMPISIGRDELRKPTGQGAQLVEVLPAEEYRRARLPDAVSLPLKELDDRMGQLDRSRPVIVYCHDSL
jgi:hypothetical protein